MFADGQMRNIQKVNAGYLRQLADAGTIRLLDADAVFEMMRNHPDPRIQRQARNVRQVMRRNLEILVEGQIPEEGVKRCR